MNLHSKDFLEIRRLSSKWQVQTISLSVCLFSHPRRETAAPFPFPIILLCVLLCTLQLKRNSNPTTSGRTPLYSFEPTPCYELGTSFYDLPRSLFSLLISFQCQRELPTLLALCFSDWVENLPLKHNTCNIRGATFVSFRNISCFFNLYNCTSGDYEKKNTEKILLFLTHLLSAPHFL